MDKKDLKVSPYGMVLKGDFLMAEVATIEEKNGSGLNDVLVRFTGKAAHDAGIDGMVMKYNTEHGGTGIDFKFTKDGSARNRMSSRNPWGDWSLYEVYLNGKTIKVKLDEKESQTTKPLELLAKFKQSA
ncbi:MAG TPA: hypothetical protein VN132_03320 [Bdellovibrio sp.]|nr:hypothetical protein [Bdellovibrio sp.]